MKKQWLASLLVVSTAIVLSACSTASAAAPAPSQEAATPEPGSALTDFPSLNAALTTYGATVHLGDPLGPAAFSVRGIAFNVDGENLIEYPYGSADDMEADAARISPDGKMIDGTDVGWGPTPHYWKFGTVIVAYYNDNPLVIDALNSVIGPQFAGGK